MESKGETCHCGSSKRHTYVPTLGHEDADEEKSKENTSPNPSISGVGGTFIQIGLVYLVERSQSASIDLEESKSMTWHTLPNFEVCALTAAKGVSLGSESMSDS